MANRKFNNPELLQKEKNAEIFAIALSNLLGTKVVSGNEFDKINHEKQQLLEKTKNIDKLKEKFIISQCKFFAFKNYHTKWKPTTRKFERRLKKLKDEKVYFEFDDYPKDIADNLKEAYNCYINGMLMACYIMILRTIEISVTIVYDQKNNKIFDNNGRPKHINMINKLNWVKENKLVGGADYNLAKTFIETLNESVHEIFIPTEKQILSAFETVINLISKLKEKK